MFGKNKNQLNVKTITPDVIASNSDYVWLIFFGQLPEYGKRLYSPFRNDSHPGCRWGYIKGEWYFIDNKGHNGKVIWSIYDFVGWLNPQLNKKGVYNLICTKLEESVPNIVGVPARRPNVTNIQQSNVTIKFEYEDWDENDYFTKEYDISPEYMNTQPYYKVVNYWCNNRKDNTIKKNPFYNPKTNTTIAYYFQETGHTKLYWPGKDKNKLKWYSNCNSDDIFGWHRIDNYSDEVVILKSAKDEMIINYHYGINTLAVQSEAIVSNLKLKHVCETKKINQIKLWYDSDTTGADNSAKFARWWSGDNNVTSEHTLSEKGGLPYISVISIPDSYGKDPAEIYKSNRGFLDKIINDEFKKRV